MKIMNILRDYMHRMFTVSQNDCRKELKTFGIGFVMKKGTTLASVLCKLKQKTEKEQKKNMDYIIKCKTCDMKYVGETGQQFHTRKQQHQRDVKNRVSMNGIYNHLKNNKKHKIGWDDAVFIDRTSLHEEEN